MQIRPAPLAPPNPQTSKIEVRLGKLLIRRKWALCEVGGKDRQTGPSVKISETPNVGQNGSRSCPFWTPSLLVSLVEVNCFDKYVRGTSWNNAEIDVFGFLFFFWTRPRQVLDHNGNFLMGYDAHKVSYATMPRG